MCSTSYCSGRLYNKLAEVKLDLCWGVPVSTSRAKVALRSSMPPGGGDRTCRKAEVVVGIGVASAINSKEIGAGIKCSGDTVRIVATTCRGGDAATGAVKQLNIGVCRHAVEQQREISSGVEDKSVVVLWISIT